MSAKIQKDKQKIVESALSLAVERGWGNVSLRDIAVHAEMSIEDLYGLIDDKDDILVLLGRMIDRQVIDNVTISEDDGNSVRDRLFDVLMDRYDALNEYREGIIAILESFKCDPKQMVISLPHLCKSMSWMLESIGVETGGIKGALKIAGVSGVYIKVLKSWMEDDSADLSKTMAKLDEALRHVERAANTFGF